MLSMNNTHSTNKKDRIKLVKIYYWNHGNARGTAKEYLDENKKRKTLSHNTVKK